MALTTMPTTSTPALTPNNNMTSEEIEQYLDHLQDEEIKQFIPTLVFLLLLAVTGLVGNVLVLVVYKFKYPKSPARIFIMSISLFDLITNVVCIPGQVFQIFHKWDFVWSSFCGFMNYTIAATTITSACILVGVAVCRYKKVCKPFGKQVTMVQAKTTTVSVTVFSWIASIPFFILSGSHSRPTPMPGIVGYDCYIADEYINTIWPSVQYGFMFILFLSLCIPMVVLYTLIGIKAYKHSKIHGVGSVHLNENSTSQQPTKTDISDLTENKPESTFFAFLNRKNNSKDRQVEEAFENGKRSMTEENRLIEKTEDCSVVKELPQIYDKGIVDFSMSSDLAPDSIIKHEEADYDGENKTGGYVTRSGDKNDMYHETMVDVHIETLDSKKSEDVNDEGYGTFPEFERTRNQNMLNTDIEDQEKSTLRYSPIKTRTIFKNVSRHNLENIFEAKDIASKISKHTSKTVNECSQTSTTGGKNMSSETTVDKEKNLIDSYVQGEKNGQRSFLKKIKVILLVITAVYILCFIPHFATVFFRYSQPANYKALGTSSLAAYHLFFQSFLINSAANPIIYSLRDANFRHNVLCLFTSC